MEGIHSYVNNYLRLSVLAVKFFPALASQKQI